jgi:hypothetical protein
MGQAHTQNNYKYHLHFQEHSQTIISVSLIRYPYCVPVCYDTLCYCGYYISEGHSASIFRKYTYRLNLHHCRHTFPSV